MRCLADRETDEIVTQTLRAFICAACEYGATILGIPVRDAQAVYETADLAALLATERDATRFLDLWEDTISDVVVEGGFLREDEFVIRVRAEFVRGALVTRIYLYNETDFSDE